MSAIRRNLLPAIPGRAAATDRAEMVTQILYGEHFEILEQEAKWVKVRCLLDDYQCWLDIRQVDASGDPEDAKHILTNTVWELSALPVPMLFAGSRLTEAEVQNLSISGMDSFESWLETWMGAPYLWGGRTIAGVDCSGLVQVAFGVQGKDLPRDAWQQAERGTEVTFVQEAQTGDLAYFDNADGRITHVGIVVAHSEGTDIIHASGEVRRDRLDHQGIFHASSGTYTHKLRIIKRL